MTRMTDRQFEDATKYWDDPLGTVSGYRATEALVTEARRARAREAEMEAHVERLTGALRHLLASYDLPEPQLEAIAAAAPAQSLGAVRAEERERVVTALEGRFDGPVSQAVVRFLRDLK